MKKPIFICLCILLAASVAFNVIFILPQKQPPSKTGSLRIALKEGLTVRPLAGARVVLLDTGEQFYTDQNGYSPIIESVAQVGDEPQMVSLLLLKEDFTETFVFCLQLSPNEMRELTISLFRKTEDSSPIQLHESYSDEYLQKFLDMYPC